MPLAVLSTLSSSDTKLTCRGYHAGRSEDLRDFLTGLQRQEAALSAGGFFLVEYSLGANMMLKFQAEYGRGFPLQAAVSVSAPLDLKATQVRMMAARNRLYQNDLLKLLIHAKNDPWIPGETYVAALKLANP